MDDPTAGAEPPTRPVPRRTGGHRRPDPVGDGRGTPPESPATGSRSRATGSHARPDDDAPARPRGAVRGTATGPDRGGLPGVGGQPGGAAARHGRPDPDGRGRGAPVEAGDQGRPGGGRARPGGGAPRSPRNDATSRSGPVRRAPAPPPDHDDADTRRIGNVPREPRRNGARPGTGTDRGLPPGRSRPEPADADRTAIVAPVTGGPVVGDVPARAPAGAETTAPPIRRRTSKAAASRRSLGTALLATAASTVVPGTGLLIVRRTRAGLLALGVFLLAVVALLFIGLGVRRAELVQNLLSSRVLVVITIGLVLAGLAWVAQIVRTWLVAQPLGLAAGRRVLGVAVVTALCLGAAAPFGYAANLVNSQRALLDAVFNGRDGGTAVADAIAKPRLNVLMVGSDAGPDRTGTRTDTMMVASIDTRTARTTIFGLPRNIGFAQFPPGTPMQKQFPRGFSDPNGDSLSGDYLLNAVYAYAHQRPEFAPDGPTRDPGLNLLTESIQYMTGLELDYYVEVDMAGFASIIDAVGGVTVDVGPVPLPIGGVLPNGTHVKPDGYVPAGVQHLNGDQALWFARSRRDSDDYNRMGRQRCLLQSVLAQKSPADVITRFNDIAAATTDSVSTNMPQPVLAALVALVGEHPPELSSVSFDPNLPDPNQRDGKFNPSRVDVAYMQQVVREALTATPTTAAPTPTTTAAASGKPTKAAKPTTAADGTQATSNSTAPQALAARCG